MRQLLANPTRAYDWGSRTAIPQLLGWPDAHGHRDERVAELWIGAHAAAPSRLVSSSDAQGAGQSLREAIGQDPARLLGARTCERFGDELPFLLKLLASERALSLQAHPRAADARVGFDRENAAGLPLGAPNRTYRDPHEKPEMIVALSPFVALSGIRPVARTLDLAAAVGLLDDPTFAAIAAPLRTAVEQQGSPPDASIRAFIRGILHAPLPAVAASIPRVETRCLALLDAPDTPAYVAAAARVWLEIAAAYPGDRGLWLAWLLEVVELAPGEALFLQPARLHAYVSGLGIELMGPSDSVARGGLTGKHVDPEELLRILDPTPGGAIRVAAHAEGPGLIRYAPPTDRFELLHLTLSPGNDAIAVDDDGPQLIIVVDGTMTLRGRGGAHGLTTPSCALSRGQAAFVSADDARYAIVGQGEAWIAKLPA